MEPFLQFITFAADHQKHSAALKRQCSLSLQRILYPFKKSFKAISALFKLLKKHITVMEYTVIFLKYCEEGYVSGP